MIRRLALLGAMGLAAAALAGTPGCAHIEAPQGGPVDSIAPVLVSIRPDTNAVLERWIGPVIFEFDEGLSEEGLQDAVTVSPRLGPVSVDKEGRELRVKPRRGWRPGLIYQVEVAGGLEDRFNNRRTEPIRLVFSTGPAIPDTRATGTVTERVTGLGSVQARVDARRLSDSLVYSTVADSSGRFTFQQIPEGEYRVLAYRDNNRNRRADPFEPRDSAALTLAVGDTATATLAILLPDTTPPRPGSARITDGWVEVRFDDYLEPGQPLADKVEVIGPDGAAVALAEVRVGAPPQAQRDTAGGDSAAAPTPAQRPTPVRRDSAAADTVPSGPLPAQSLFARPVAPLLPDTLYTVRVRDVRNVNGLVGAGEVPLRTPRPAPPPRPAPADSAAAPDSAAVEGDSAVVRRRAPVVEGPPPAPTPSPAPATPPARAMRAAPGARREG